MSLIKISPNQPFCFNWRIGKIHCFDASFQNRYFLSLEGCLELIVIEPDKLKRKLSGTKGILTRNGLTDMFLELFNVKSKIKSLILLDLLYRRLGYKAILSQLDEISTDIKTLMTSFWNDFGMNLAKFQITKVEIDRSKSKKREPFSYYKMDESLNPKALFELGSHESHDIPFENRIEIMAFLVRQGYDLHRVVRGYLIQKVALHDITRISCIASTFSFYSDRILEYVLEDVSQRKPLSDLEFDMYKKLFRNQTSHVKTDYELRDSIDRFIFFVNVADFQTFGGENELLDKMKANRSRKKNPYNIRIFKDFEDLKQSCNKAMMKLYERDFITDADDDQVTLRYMKPDGKIAYVGLGKFYFAENRMIIFSNNESCASFHNPEYFALAETRRFSKFHKYAFKGLYCGIYTGFIDDYGKRVFTGDVMTFTCLPNPEVPSQGGTYRASNPSNPNFELPDRKILMKHYLQGFYLAVGKFKFHDYYHVILDNHVAPLPWLTRMMVVGNVLGDRERWGDFFDVEKACTTHMWERCGPAPVKQSTVFMPLKIRRLAKIQAKRETITNKIEKL